ncbi:MAG: polyprenyl synthetase family protein [Bacteroidetes bacterium]|nr:polyprenyl synthetase family protein [Bacteroidota bacterium]
MNTLLSLQKRINSEINSYSATLQLSPAELYEPISYTLLLGGKRMRPVLLLMACDLFDGNIDTAIQPALGIEVFHNFTLLHDDIMDKAPLRRNQATVHEKWNSNVAILSGDTMFVKSYQLIMQTPDAHLRAALEIFCQTAIEVCEGQQLDMNFETQKNVSIADYLHMISLKTAVLLAASLKIGAIIGGANSPNAQSLYDFGKNIGIAFQLQDDILDVFGDAKKFGKQVGGDILSNKKTFLLLSALEQAKGNNLEDLNSWLSKTTFVADEKIGAVKSLFEKLQVKSMAEAKMNEYYQLAIHHLNEVNCNPEKKASLLAFAESLMVREI